MIKKHRREPRKSPSCSTILSKKAAQCILHCAESHVFTNLFSCANEDDALVDTESASGGNNESSVQERSRRLKTSKHKKEKKRRPSRETEAEQTPVVFDSGGISFCLGVGHPGSDQDNDEIDDREEHGSRDSSWEQDTIVMRRHDSSSIDSEAEDDENQVRRKSKEKQQHRHRHRHRHHHSEKSRSSSSHPSRRSGSRSRSNRDSSRSRSKSSTRTSSSRSRSRSKSGKSPSKSRRGFGCKKEDSSVFLSSKGKHQCPSPSKSRR